MKKLCKELKRQRKRSVYEEEKQEINNKIKGLKKDIVEEERHAKSRKIKRVVDNIRCKGGAINGDAFWEFRKKMKRSNNYATAINDKDGNKIDTNEGIRKVYKDFYKELLSGNNATTEEEIDREKEVEELFQKVMEAGKLQRPIKVDDSDVREAIGNLKKKKAKDIQGWRNEIVIEGGEEMVISIKKMCNEIITKEELPIDWEEMIINSIHKKGSIFDMNNKRGLFLTNILSCFSYG